MGITHLTWMESRADRTGTIRATKLAGNGVEASVVTWSMDRAEAALPSGSTVVIRGDEAEGGMAWLPGPRRAFEAFIAQAEAEGGGRRLVVWPGMGLPISDVPSLLSFLRARERFGFVLDADALIPEGIPGEVADHVDRVLSALAEHPCLWGVSMPRRVAMTEAQRATLEAALARCGIRVG